MLDQLSYNPSPSPESAKIMMYNEITKSRKYYNGKYQYINKNYVKNTINKIIENMLPFGSEAAWYMHHHPEIIRLTNIEIEKYYQKTRYWRKLRLYVKYGFILIKLWRESIENMYHPDSKFVHECVEKYDSFFKVKPPPPPN